MIVARTQDQVNEAVNQLRSQFGKHRVSGIATDLLSKDGRAEVHVAVDKELDGKLDILINNVGTNVRTPIHETTQEEYDSIIGLNVTCTFELTKELGSKLWASKGTIVNISSAAGIQSSGTGCIYAMSKGAINQFTRALACEWAPRGVRVNAVCPWMTMTPLLREAVRKDSSQTKEVEAWTPLHRLSQPEEPAAVAAFLCLPASSYMTGQVLSVDGGISAQGFQGPCIMKPEKKA